MSEFIDRLAHVLNREIGSFFGPEECRAPVRAILTEMRDAVTEEMIAAMRVAMDCSNPDIPIREGFQAALDVALTEAS